MTICVRHRDGWCATRRRKVPKPDSYAPQFQPIVCRNGMPRAIAGEDYAEREPMCAECRQKLGLSDDQAQAS